MDATELEEAPPLPQGTITLQTPPDKAEDSTTGNILGTLLPMLGSMGVMIFMAFSSQDTRSLLMGGGMALAMLSMAGFNIYRQINGFRRQVDTSRREYLAYLAEMRDTVRTVARQQRRHLTWQMPEPSALVFLAEEGSRVWDRDRTSPTALQARLGVATRDLSMQLDVPELPPLANPDAVCLSAISRFVTTHSRVDGIPVGLDLGQLSHLQIVGQAEQVRSELRALITHLATLTPPSALLIAVLCSQEQRPQWEWMKWLPHVGSTRVSDAIGPARMIVSRYEDLIAVLDPDILSRNPFEPRSATSAWPQLLLIVDDAPPAPADSALFSAIGLEGVTLLTLPQQWHAMVSETSVRLVIHPPTSNTAGSVLELVTIDGVQVTGVADQMSPTLAEAIARRLLQYRVAATDEAAIKASTQGDPAYAKDLMELLRIGDIRDFDPDKHWRYRTGRERLRVPLGVTATGTPVFIDIKESAEQGMGPHGLLIGATGSGKSEVLRTLVLALALTHSPEQLNLVLVDFKGGATFAGMSELPHVSAMISNLASELSLVDRMEDALRGEMNRRQEVLRAAGNFANVGDYEAARRAGKHNFPPLPALFIVLDEFSELLSANPDFINTFVAIGRLGRSMAIHLLLASQRLEESKLRGLDSHLSYRVGLRTFSAAESRTVLGVPDAYDLPPIPGIGYLKTGSAEHMTRFRASYVAAPPPPRESAVQTIQATETDEVLILPFTSDPQEKPQADQPQLAALVAAPPPADGSAPDPYAGMTEMDIGVARMAGHGQAHQIWLPPLDVSDTFSSLMPDLQVVPGFGLISLGWRNQGWLRVPVGTVDIPLEQRRDPMVFDLSGAGGHLLVLGGPLTGKSTLLRTLVMALMLTHTPQEVQFYVMDLGGGTFSAFAQATHIAGVAGRDQPEILNRMMSEIEAILADRELFFRSHSIDSMTSYRQGRSQGLYNDGYGDIFLVVDGFSVVKTDFSDLEMRIAALSTRALTFGIHFLFASGRAMDVRQNLRDVIGSRFELRLGDPADSEIDRKIAQRVPLQHPGRGLEPGKHHVLIGLPRIDPDPNPATLSEGVTASLQQIAAAWQGPAGPKLRLLPELVSLDHLRAMVPQCPQIILGVEESRLGPLLFNPWEESFLYLFGDADTGKSTFLHALSLEIMRTHTPKQAQIYLIDIKRSLLGEIPEEYLAGYLTRREIAEENMTGLAAYLQTRLPGADITPAQLRDRSWWTGAEAWILVDDYDLVATSMGNPLSALQPLMAQAHDCGFHIVITRRSGGASRAVRDPIIQTMAELGASGILLPGDPDEGPLVGRYKPMKGLAGRAQYISRDKGRIAAQLAWVEPSL